MQEYLDLIHYYVPSLFKLFKPGTRQRKKIEEAYEGRISCIQQSDDNCVDYVAKEAFVDLLWDARNGDKDALLKLEFLQRTVTDLCRRVPDNLKSSIGSICYKMIVEMPTGASSYFTYLAELATLNLLIRDQQTALLSHEACLANGKTIDYLILKDGEQYFIEVFTILVTHEKVVSGDELKRFIERRLEDKLNDKLASLHTVPLILLVPVLWCTNGGNLLQYASVLRTIKETYSCISYFMIFGKYHLAESGEESYQFVTLDHYATQNVLSAKGV